MTGTRVGVGCPRLEFLVDGGSGSFHRFFVGFLGSWIPPPHGTRDLLALSRKGVDLRVPYPVSSDSDLDPVSQRSKEGWINKFFEGSERLESPAGRGPVKGGFLLDRRRSLPTDLFRPRLSDRLKVSSRTV